MKSHLRSIKYMAMSLNHCVRVEVREILKKGSKYIEILAITTFIIDITNDDSLILKSSRKINIFTTVNVF